MRKVMIGIVVAAILFPQTGNTKDEKVKRLQNFYTGIMFTPEINFWKGLEQASSSSGYSYKGIFSYSTGFDFVKMYTDKLGLSIGTYYTHAAFEREDHCFTCDVEYTPVSTFLMNGFQLPVSAYYMLLNDRLDVYLIGGINNWIYTSVKEQRITYQGNTDLYNPSERFSNFLFGISGGLGVNYNLNYRWSVGLNTIYKNSLLPVTQSPLVKLSSVNLNFGFYYKFN
ncbi:MAG: hypothetical protein ACOZCO_14765 [Bacteroidota bacterium]